MRIAETFDSLRFRIASALGRFAPPLVAHRLAALVYSERSASEKGRIVVARGLLGGKLTVSTGDHVGYGFAVRGAYDWRNLVAARALCPRGATILEIGANIGSETIGYAGIVGASGRVVAYEPLDANVRALAALVNANGLNNVTVVPAAVGSKAGVASFVIPHGRNSGLGFVATSHVADHATIEVPVVTLDDVASHYGRVDLLAIDVEGFEMEVLRGAADLIRRRRPNIILEAEESQMIRAGSSQAELCDWLFEAGYAVYAIGRLRLVELAANARSSETSSWRSRVTTYNWIAIPREASIRAVRVDRALMRCGLMPARLGIGASAARTERGRRK